MKKILSLAAVWFMVFQLSVWAQSISCETFKKEYQPQNSPEATYQLELDMMKQGAYCYDLPIFDPDWQARSSADSINDSFKTTAGFFDVPSKTYQEGKYAIVYYPGHKTLGPVFLYREGGKWFLDRSSVNKFIHYGEEWMAYDGDYPYLELLKKVFSLEEGIVSGGRKAYRAVEQ